MAVPLVSMGRSLEVSGLLVPEVAVADGVTYCLSIVRDVLKVNDTVWDWVASWLTRTVKNLVPLVRFDPVTPDFEQLSVFRQPHGRFIAGWP